MALYKGQNKGSGITKSVEAGTLSKRRRKESIPGNCCRRNMPGQGMRVSACTVAFKAAHGERLCEGEGFVPSRSTAVRRARQCEHGQVVPRSGHCRRCVRGTMAARVAGPGAR
eukprot:2225756-Pleurochrysis_carterae.AAC.1